MIEHAECAEDMSPHMRVASMHELLGAIASNNMSEVEELGRFIDLYDAHEVPEEERPAFYESLDVPEHNVIFGDSTFDSIVEEYDALGGVPREQLPFGASAIPTELEISIGKAYVAVADASNFLQSQENNETVEPEILSRRREFDEFAQKMGYSQALATRAWSKLADRFILRAQPERYKDRSWYRHEHYTDVPANLFASHPAIDDKRNDGSYHYMDKVTGLRLDVLEDLLAKIEANGSDASAIHEMLGHNAGLRTFQFLKQFAKSKRQESETHLPQ